MKKTIGYGYKLSCESLELALSYYGPTDGEIYGFHRTKKELLKAIKKDRSFGGLPKSARPRIFKVVVEVL